ncbi:MAG: T9SS type A sorting domain-containing protein [Breznakibacter sp.]
MERIYFFTTDRLVKLILLGMGFVAAFTSKAQDIDTGLKLHYSFDAVSETFVADDSGNNNPGTLNGNATVTSGHSGQGIMCTAKADYIAAPANINVGLTSFTFATWAKFSALKNASRFFDWGNGVDATNNFLAFIPSYNADDAYMALRYRMASGTAYNVTSTTKCPVGEWAHVAVTFNWSAASNTATAIIYLNGEPVGSANGLPYNPNSGLGNTAGNYFGYSRWTQDTNGFNGIFDDIRVYDRALTADDILTLTGLKNLNLQYEALDLGDLSAVSDNLPLPAQGPDYPDVAISWSSSNAGIISNTGVVNRPDYFNSPVTLTATLTLGQNSKTKTFAATVLAQEGTTFDGDLLVRYDFSNLNGRTVKDVAEKQFTGTLVNNATIRTIGTWQTGIYNVLDLGNGTGYFDMGAETGKVVCLLNDYTMCTYFRIENDYTGLSSHGNFIWNFSNSNNAATSQNGYIIGSLKNQSVSITPGYYTVTSGNQAVVFDSEALKGNWHHMAYTQKGNTGTLYIDGIPLSNATISNKPSTALIKSGLMGTPYNWIGRSCYTSDVYLRRTMVYDFRIYGKALTDEEIGQAGLDVPGNIAKLETAYNAFVATGKTDETQLLEKTYNPEASVLEIVGTNNGSTHIDLASLKKVTFTDPDMQLWTANGASQSLATAGIAKMLFTQNATSIKPVTGHARLSATPNPATRYIRLDNIAADRIVSLYSLSGQLLLQHRTALATDKIDVSALPSGVYIVKTGHWVTKFTKK